MSDIVAELDCWLSNGNERRACVTLEYQSI